MRVNNSVLAGKSVRSASQAAGTPKASATKSDMREKPIVSRRTVKVRGSENTSTKFCAV